jgi:ketosteroid isomerase-like protein
MSTADEKRLVLRCFEAMQMGDPGLAELLADDVTWWGSPRARFGGLRAGKAAVLEHVRSGLALSDAAPDAGSLRLGDEDGWIWLQATREGRSWRGETIRSHCRFSFRVEAGRIREVRERPDLPPTQQKLFP